jgi:hypothetical protein
VHGNSRVLVEQQRTERDVCCSWLQAQDELDGQDAVDQALLNDGISRDIDQDDPIDEEYDLKDALGDDAAIYDVLMLVPLCDWE